ncbi:hypothetical protein BV898_18149 [Hypsibius exemplaris]|uniref:Receptor ligand binding region domain-containing protein n=1 Tax=Hypsibius exemplaris TaxID=2072580 RepID=A0A9X6NGP4_HYPEX|nr:hypothetical protein BV898_18149 [Hypsibius exemplaris]
MLCEWVQSATRLEVLVLLPKNQFLGPSDVVYTGPAYELAAEHSMAKYGKNLSVSVTYLLQSPNRNYDDLPAYSVQMVSGFYYSRKPSDHAETCYALAASPMVDQPGLQSVTEAFDWMLFNVVLSNPKYPVRGNGVKSTAIATGGALVNYAIVLLEILRFYDWHHAAMVVEVKPPGFSFHNDLADIIAQTAAAAKDSFVLEKFGVDLGNQDTTFEEALLAAKRKYRVIILLVPGVAAVKILQMTPQFGMANGEYAFFNLQFGSYGRPEQFEYNRNDSALLAYQALIFISYHTPKVVQLQTLNTVLKERSRTLYNYTYPNGSQPLDSSAVEAAFNVVELFAAVVNETSGGPDETCSGMKLASRMANRRFDLTLGNVFINSAHLRNLELDIYSFNTTTKSLQVAGALNWQKNRLEWKESISWPTVDGKAPPDTPLCGFSGNEGPCTTKGGWWCVRKDLLKTGGS